MWKVNKKSCALYQTVALPMTLKVTSPACNLSIYHILGNAACINRLLPQTTNKKWYNVVSSRAVSDDLGGCLISFTYLQTVSCAVVQELTTFQLLATAPLFRRPFVKRFALRYRTVVCLSVLSVLSCMRRWCIEAKRFDGSRWNLACR